MSHDHETADMKPVCVCKLGRFAQARGCVGILSFRQCLLIGAMQSCKRSKNRLQPLPIYRKRRPASVKRNILDAIHEAVAWLQDCFRHFTTSMPHSPKNSCVHFHKLFRVVVMTVPWCPKTKCDHIHWNLRRSISSSCTSFFLPSCVNKIKGRSFGYRLQWLVCVFAFAFRHEVQNNFGTENHVTLRRTRNGEFRELNTPKTNIRIQWTLLLKQNIFQ